MSTMNLILSRIVKTFLLIGISSLVFGCAVNSRNQLLDAGQTALDTTSLETLVAEKSFQLTASDFDGEIYFKKNGKISARNRGGDKTTGKWEITPENTLCLKFSDWYFGDLKCYSVFADPESKNYIFFTSNGARYYTATPMTGTPGGLTKQLQGSSDSPATRRQTAVDTEGQPEHSAPPVTIDTPAPEPSKAEMKHLLVTTALNCPGCDFNSVDLSNADLLGANLAGTNLAGANLSKANLRRANLRGANLTGANLTTANLPGADLSNSILRDADFTGANLVKANFTGALTDGIILQDTHLEGTTGIK
jgi:hypothetical protein